MSNYVAVPNQKVITTNGDTHNKNNVYACIGVDNLITAMQILKPTTFKLWVYMAKNQNGYQFALSCVEACKCCGFKATAFHAAVQELITVGYLIDNGNNQYDFYEKLQKKEELNITTHK